MISNKAMASFIISPIKRVRSCPTLHMSTPISPKTIKKELAVGALMAGATILSSGEHNHLTTFKELENIISYETIGVLSNLEYDRRSKYNRLIKIKKYKAFFMLVILPFLIRYLAFTGIQYFV